MEDEDEEKRRENAVLYTVLSHSHSYYSLSFLFFLLVVIYRIIAPRDSVGSEPFCRVLSECSALSNEYFPIRI